MEPVYSPELPVIAAYGKLPVMEIPGVKCEKCGGAVDEKGQCRVTGWVDYATTPAKRIIYEQSNPHGWRCWSCAWSSKHGGSTESLF